MTQCKWLHAGEACMLGLYDGKPSQADCQACERYEGSPRGAGDVVHRVALGAKIKPCKGCKGRRRRLNRLFPFARRS